MRQAVSGDQQQRKWTDQLLLVLIHGLVWGYVARIFVRPQDGWLFYFAALSIAILMLAFFRARSWFRIFSGVFLLSGFGVMWQNGVPLTDAWKFFGSTTNVLTLLILAPFFTIPITLGAYHRSAQLMVRGRVRQPHSTYFVLTSFTYLLSTLMNIAAIAAAYTTLHHLSRSFPKVVEEKINFAAFSRGQILAMIWSPVGATLGVAMARVPANPGPVIAVGLGYSIFIVLLDTWLMKGWVRRHAAAALQPTTVEQKPHSVTVVHWRRMAIFCGVIVVFIIGIIVLHEVFSMSVIDAVILLILVVSLLWSLALNKPNRLWQELRAKSTVGMLGLLPQMMLFISVGFFTQVLTEVGSLDPLVRWVSHWSVSFGWLFILLIAVFAVASSQMGLYPALVVMLLADLVPYEAMHLRPEWFVFAITAGAVCSTVASPLSVVVNVTAAVMKEDPLRISRNNFFFVAALIPVVSLVTIVLSTFFPA